MSKYFKGVTSKDEAKKLYRELVKRNHPDIGGSDDVMRAINVEYERVMETHFDTNKTESGAFMAVINKLTEIDVDVELIGSWIWVGGSTKPHKELLKELGFIWHATRKLWYLADNTNKFKSRSKSTTEELREKYGSQVIKRSEEKVRLSK